jgi:chemotaxis response regulator CheB
MSKPELSLPMLVGIGASAGGLEALKALRPYAGAAAC